MLVLFTDFGIGSPYMGEMKAALYRHGAKEPIIDLCADAEPYNIKAAAYLLAAYVERFPPGAVFVCVVDPGVGGPRRPLALHCGERWLVGPDNGLFSVLPHYFAALEAWEITWRPAHLSATFHGRDLFAPTAAALLRGERDTLKALPAWTAQQNARADLWEIVYIDHYGNAFSGVRAAAIERGAVLRAGGRRITQAGTFSDVEAGALFWYENSVGLVEIAANQDSAAKLLHAEIGMPLTLEKGTL